MKWSFDASTLGRDIDMEGLACGADDCASALYAGDEYNYVYKLDFASGTVTHEWDLRDIVGSTPTDRGIEGLAFDGDWWYVGIQGTDTIHKVRLHEGPAPTPKLFLDTVPNLYLATVLDEQYDGYCIDFQGHDFDNPKCNLIRAHTCKPGPNDTQFEYRPEDGTIRSILVDEDCNTYTGGGGCLTAMEMVSESIFEVGPCTLDAKQVWAQYSDG